MKFHALIIAASQKVGHLSKGGGAANWKNTVMQMYEMSWNGSQKGYPHPTTVWGFTAGGVEHSTMQGCIFLFTNYSDYSNHLTWPFRSERHCPYGPWSFRSFFTFSDLLFSESRAKFLQMRTVCNFFPKKIVLSKELALWRNGRDAFLRSVLIGSNASHIKRSM